MVEKILTDAEKEIKKMQNELAAAGGAFEYRVKTWRRESGCSIMAAIEAAVKCFPDSHRDFLERCQAGTAYPLT